MYLHIPTYWTTSLQIDSLIDRNSDFHRFYRYLCICTYLHTGPHPCRMTEPCISTDFTDIYVYGHSYIHAHRPTETYIFTDSTDTCVFIHTCILDHILADSQTMTEPCISTDSTDICVYAHTYILDHTHPYR